MLLPLSSLPLHLSTHPRRRKKEEKRKNGGGSIPPPFIGTVMGGEGARNGERLLRRMFQRSLDTPLRFQLNHNDTVTREHDRGEGERRRYWIWNFPSVEFVSRKSDELRHLLSGGKKEEGGLIHQTRHDFFLFGGSWVPSHYAQCSSSSSPLHKSAIISVGLLASQWKMVRHPRWMAGFLRSRAMRDESLINVFDVSFFGISVHDLPFQFTQSILYL